MLELVNIRLPLAASETDHVLRRAAAQALGVPTAEIADVRLAKRSVDARKKSDVHFVATLVVSLSDPAQEPAFVAQGIKQHVAYVPLVIPRVDGVGSEDVAGAGAAADIATSSDAAADDTAACLAGAIPRPYVVGAGPAGLFAALYLARVGLRPILIERGPAVEQRIAAVAEFERTGVLDPEANIQFGEGGAGTFSDGKLTTNTKNPYTKHVLRWFFEAGAPEEVLWQAKPHMGTDRLVGVVRSLRRQIIDAGGSVQFETRLDAIVAADGAITSIILADTKTGERQTVETGHLIVACGHSARDTFAMLRDAGTVMEQKPFSVGVRIEHTQRAIDVAQYGQAADNPALGAAEYKLAVHLRSGRGVYTFCMCPGGEVVCAASEEGGVVVNGMSRFARDGANANSALLVGVDPADFGSDDVLAGVELQRSMEQAAYRLGFTEGSAYRAPAQTVGDFLASMSGQASATTPANATSHVPPSPTVAPTYARGVVWCDLRECLPGFVADALVEALPLFDRRLRGFADPAAVITGVETRSSSPVRIVRDDGFQARIARDDGADVVAGAPTGAQSDASTGVSSGTSSGSLPELSSGLYPCGEGAGYAGGIMSAAVDGLRVAERLAADILNEQR